MVYILTIAIAFGVAQLVRQYIESKEKLLERKTLIKDKVDIIHMHNKGALLNTFENKPKLVSSVMLIAVGMLMAVFGESMLEKKASIKKFGLSMMLGGAISNVYERISKGYVVDYINLPKVKGLKKIVFNIADMCIVFGAIITVIGSIFRKK